MDGWRRSATEVFGVIESRLKLVRYEFMVERLRWFNAMFSLSAGGTWGRLRGVDAVVQMILAKVAVVLRLMLANRIIYGVLRSAWRTSKWIKRTLIAH